MGIKGDKTKEFILEKALSLFAEKGFKNVTMKDICMETGLSSIVAQLSRQKSKIFIMN